MPTYAQIEAVFERAIALPAPERDAFLDTHCARDSALRAAVAEALRAHATADGFLDREATADAAATLAPGPAAGLTLGAYTLIEEIGRGGFSTVWRARQERPVRREVAIKRIAPGMDSLQVLRRFALERQALAMLDHPAIARVFDAGLDDVDRPYFVMELVAGEPLTRWAANHPADRRARLTLFLEICAGVIHAHQRGVIHRDLKPSNLLVGETGPKIIDFGIARVLGGRPEETGLTRDGQIVGTPAYLAPELMTGAAADTRADVFSLGVVLCELLTGRPPRDPKTFDTTPAGAWRQVVDQRPAHWPRLGNDLDAILARSLETEPERRYGSVIELAADLRAFLDGRPVVARRPTALYLVRRFAGRHRVGVAAAAIALLGLAGGGALAWKQKRAADEARQRAEREAGDAREALSVLQGIIFKSNPEFGQRADLTVAELIDQLAAKPPPSMLANPRLEFELRYALGVALIGRSKFAEAEPHLQRALEVARQEYGRDDDRVALVQYALTTLHTIANRPDQAQAAAAEAMRIFALTRGPRSEFALRSRGLRAQALVDAGRAPEAEHEARALLVDAEAARSPLAPRASWILGRALVRLERLEEAEAAARRYLEGQPALTGAESLEVWDARRFLGEVWHRQGRHAEASALLREVLANQRAHYGPDHRTVQATAAALALAEKALNP
jgi:tetratricopeptide (TPR) repeat protein